MKWLWKAGWGTSPKSTAVDSFGPGGGASGLGQSLG